MLACAEAASSAPRSPTRALDLPWAATIAFLVGDQAAMLELDRRAIRGLQWERWFQTSVVLYVIAGALAATQPKAAAGGGTG